VSESNYRDGAVERDQECDPPQGLFQKHLCSARAELFGPFISRDPARQWAKPHAISASENESLP